MLFWQIANRPVLEQKAQVNVWQQIGAQEPSAAASSLMKQNDNFGYKSRTQMLAQGQPQVNVWQQIGAQEPKAAAAQLMKQNDNFGYKAPTQKLFALRNKKMGAKAQVSLFSWSNTETYCSLAPTRYCMSSVSVA